MRTKLLIASPSRTLDLTRLTPLVFSSCHLFILLDELQHSCISFLWSIASYYIIISYHVILHDIYFCLCTYYYSSSLGAILLTRICLEHRLHSISSQLILFIISHHIISHNFKSLFSVGLIVLIITVYCDWRMLCIVGTDICSTISGTAPTTHGQPSKPYRALEMVEWWVVWCGVVWCGVGKYSFSASAALPCPF